MTVDEAGRGFFAFALLRDDTTGVAPIAPAAERNATAWQAISASECSEGASSRAWPGIRTKSTRPP